MREMELVTLAAAVDDRKGPRPGQAGDGPKHAVVHTECLNCGAALQGKYCAQCGQGVDDHHRSILHLVWEVVQDFTHLDGRLMQTLPPLFLKPGELARDHFEGRRQRHVPPLRLFLITLLIFMAVLEFKTSGGRTKIPVPPSVAAAQKAADARQAERPAAAAKAAAEAASKAVHIDIPGVKIDVGDDGKPAAAPPPATDTQPKAKTEDDQKGRALGAIIRSAVRPDGTPAPKASAPRAEVNVGSGFLVAGNGTPANATDAEAATQGFDEMAKSKFGQKPFGKWVTEHGRRALANKQYFRATIFEWGHRLSILMLPIFAGFLTLCYFYKKKFYVYDHLIVSMHFLSFVFLIWALAYGLPSFLGAIMMLVATIWTPINLFMTLRGAYGSSVLGAVVKTFALWVATLTIFLAMLLGVIFVAMGQI